MIIASMCTSALTSHGGESRSISPRSTRGGSSLAAGVVCADVARAAAAPLEALGALAGGRNSTSSMSPEFSVPGKPTAAQTINLRTADGGSQSMQASIPLQAAYLLHSTGVIGDGQGNALTAAVYVTRVLSDEAKFQLSRAKLRPTKHRHSPSNAASRMRTILSGTHEIGNNTWPGRQTRLGTQSNDAGWSSQVAREAHNLEVAGSNPVPATYHTFRRKLRLTYLPTFTSAALKKNSTNRSSISRSH
jgi:hypothetical protein